MQVAAIVVYIICGLFSSSFVTNYVIVVVLLMLDFWTVSISGLPSPHALRLGKLSPFRKSRKPFQSGTFLERVDSGG